MNFFGSTRSTTSTSATSTRSQHPQTKQYFKDNKLSGLYQDIDPQTGRVREEGMFQYGEQVGTWKEIDQDGDQIHYVFSKQRVGAICGDGTRSSATGRGACSWHGGVAQWLHQNIKSKIGGTGKYVPIEQRIQDMKNKVRDKLQINKNGLQFDELVLKHVLSLLDQTTILKTEKRQAANDLVQKDKQLQQEKKKREEMSIEKKKMAEKIKQLEGALEKYADRQEERQISQAISKLALKDDEGENKDKNIQQKEKSKIKIAQFKEVQQNQSQEEKQPSVEKQHVKPQPTLKKEVQKQEKKTSPTKQQEKPTKETQEDKQKEESAKEDKNEEKPQKVSEKEDSDLSNWESDDGEAAEEKHEKEELPLDDDKQKRKLQREKEAQIVRQLVAKLNMR